MMLGGACSAFGERVGCCSESYILPLEPGLSAGLSVHCLHFIDDKQRRRFLVKMAQPTGAAKNGPDVGF